MKIAALVLSYAAPHNVSLLAEYFGAAADLYIHYDRKLGARNDLPRPQRAHVVPPRPVFWGGWGMVESMIELLQAARQRSDADRFVLISDDSAPLLPIDEMVARLERPTDLIWCDVHVAGQVVERYKNFYFFDHLATSARHVPPLERTIDNALFAAMREAGALMQGRGKKPVALRHGPQWWSLTREAVERVLSQHRDDEWLRASFQFSAIPDEMYVHTLLGRDVRERFMLADWTRPEKPTTFDSVDAVRSCDTRGYLFVRKVDTSVPELAQLMRTGRMPAG